jgi:hypothetical protein
MAWTAALRLSLSALCAAALCACGGGEGPAPPAEELAFAEVAVSAFSGISEPRFAAVHDDAGWAALWAEHVDGISPAPPRPVVDFATQGVAALFLGESPACRRAEVRSLSQSQGVIRLRYRVREAGPTEICIAAITTPALMVRFANAADLRVEFVRD